MAKKKAIRRTRTTAQTLTEAETSQVGNTMSTGNGATPADVSDVKTVDSFLPEATSSQATFGSTTASAEQMATEAEENARTTNKTQTETETISQPDSTTSTVNGVTPEGTISGEACDSFQLEAPCVRAASRLATANEEQMTAEAEPNAGTRNSVGEKHRLEDTLECDAFLKDWDMTIRTCPHCQRPFGTPERLSKHQAEWISGSCITMRMPRYKNPCVDESDIEDLVPGADLIVSVDDGKTARRFRVPSQVLATASRCFQVSFGPTAQFESANEVRRAAIRGNCPANIDLDDNPAAMELVLKILCLRYHELPKTLEFRSIVEIAVVADKYELDLVLRPWVKQWLEPFQSKLFEYGKPASGSNDKTVQPGQPEHDWLFVSWVFGYQDAFV